MKKYKIKTHPEKDRFAKEKQLAYIFANAASQNTQANRDSIEMVGNRIIDNASVAIASLNRAPVKCARMQALAHLRKDGAQLYGIGNKIKVHAEWAAWANGTAVRELDFHDTFLAEDYSHPGDNIPPLHAVAEQKNIGGRELVQGILTAYEIQVNLVKAICLHKHKIDHIAHLAPAAAAGIGTMLNLDVEVIYQAINQAEHLSISTRQSRKGEISSWKAFAPAHAGKIAIEAVDRAMRGEKAPSPIWEGEDSIISWILDGKDASYSVPFPEPQEEFNAILETYTKQYSAEYQAQALIDLAFELRTKIDDFNNIKEIIIETSHHTHNVIGTGSQDPQKFDPNASRETLDHSIMYIFAVALEDGKWHHVDSYTKKRANRPETIKLWNKIKTKEDPKWTKKYHSTNPNKKCFGAKVKVILHNNKSIVGTKERANAHPAGSTPFERRQYQEKFLTLTEGIVKEKETKKFFQKIEKIYTLSPKEISNLLPIVEFSKIDGTKANAEGIF